MRRLSVVFTICVLLALCSGAQAAFRPAAIGDLFHKGPSGFDVRSYGAVGDGATDDEPAFALAIAAAAGGRLIIPEAATSYKLSSNVTVPAGVTVVFQQGGLLLIDNAITFTVNGTMEAGLYQIFSGAGTAVLGVGPTPEVYPQWWGATGGGVGDDGPAIQLAITAAASVGNVFIPPGTYLTSVTLAIVNNGITVTGTESSIIKIDDGADVGGFSISADQVVIENLTIDGNVANQSDGEPAVDIENDSSNDVTIRGLRIVDMHNFGIAVRKGNTKIHISDNYIDTVGVAPAERDCVYVTGDTGSYSEDIVIQNNILKNPSRNGVGLSTAVRNVVVAGNHVENCATWGIGGESVTGAVFVEDVIVSGNTIDTAKRPLAIADDCLRWIVIGNTVTGGTFNGIFVERADPGTIITNNIVHGNERDGILVNETTNVVVSHNVVFDNSNETHNNWSGIAFTNVQNGSVNGNVVTDTGGAPLHQYGIALDASTTDINGEGNVAVGNQSGDFIDSGSNNFVQMVTTLTQTQWGYLAALDQSLATTDDPAFAGLFVRDPSALGSEIHTDANAASDPNSNEADATTGWSDIQVTLTSDSGDPQTGTYALKGVADDGDTDRIEYDFTAVVGATYKVSIWAKRGAQGTSQFFQNWTNIAIPQTSISSATWTEYTFYVVATGTAAKIRVYAAGTGAAGDEVFVDNVSIKQVTGGILSVADDFNVGGVSYLNGLLAADIVSNTYNFAADTAADDDYLIALTPAPAAYTTGMMITFTAVTANTGACTVKVGALAVISLKSLHDQDPANDYIEAGSVVVAVYDGSVFQIITPDANP